MKSKVLITSVALVINLLIEVNIATGEDVIRPHYYNLSKGSYLNWGYNDLNEDGISDTLLTKWNEKTCVYVGDDGVLPWTAEDEDRNWDAYFDKAFNVGKEPPKMWNQIRANWGNYTILVDLNGNGRFDDNADFYYKILDLNHDGAPEAEYFHLFPGTLDWSNKLVVNLDGERDMSYLDWQNFSYPDEHRYLPGGKYIMNVHGSGFFLNCYSQYVQDSWENPIAWYDFDFDGRTNMVMRAADDNIYSQKKYCGNLCEFEIAFELNGNTSKQKWHSLDLQLTYYSYNNKGPDYTRYADNFPLLAGLPQAAFLSERLLGTRQETIRHYWPYMDGYKIASEFKNWEGLWLLFDEDDDDNRFEEMFTVHEYSNDIWADKIGDRMEDDKDFSGKANLYIGKFDGRIHLYGADEGYWEIDYLGLYKGSAFRAETDEGPEPSKGFRYPQVRYYDTDKNGFIDRIEYSTVEYKNEDKSRTIERVINLLDFATPDNLHPDVCELIDLKVNAPITSWRVDKWDSQPLQAKDFAGTANKEIYDKFILLYSKTAQDMWSDSMKLYKVAKKYKLNKSENLDRNLKIKYTKDELLDMKELVIPQGYSRHLKANDRREKYHNGFWLKEKVFNDILVVLPEKVKKEALRYYYTGEIDTLCKYLDSQIKIKQNKANKIMDSNQHNLLRRCETAVNKATDYLLKHYRPDGQYQEVGKDLVAYYKSPYVFSKLGYTEQSKATLDYIKTIFLDEEGDLNRNGKKTDILIYKNNLSHYMNSWVIRGAVALDQKKLAIQMLEFLKTQQDKQTGGIYTKHHQKQTDIGTTAAFGLAALDVGDLRAAVQAGNFLKLALDNQPEEHNFYVRFNGIDPVTNIDEEMAVFFVICTRKTSQAYWYPGIAMNFLTHLAHTTRDHSYLDTARKYREIVARCSDDKYNTLASGKVGWGAKALYQFTGDKKLLETAEEITKNLVDLQLKNGCWSFSDSADTPEEKAMTIDVTAELALWVYELRELFFNS